MASDQPSLRHASSPNDVGQDTLEESPRQRRCRMHGYGTRQTTRLIRCSTCGHFIRVRGTYYYHLPRIVKAFPSASTLIAPHSAPVIKCSHLFLPHRSRRAQPRSIPEESVRLTLCLLITPRAVGD